MTAQSFLSAGTPSMISDKYTPCYLQNDRVENAVLSLSTVFWDNRSLPVMARNAALVICHIFMKFRGPKAHPNSPRNAMACPS